MSWGMMVTRLAWIAHRLVSSKSPTSPERSRARASEKEPADEQLGRLLVVTDFTECDGSRAVAERLFVALHKRRPAYSFGQADHGLFFTATWPMEKFPERRALYYQLRGSS
eukprot:6757264-Prymnesium_polylepis.2